MVEEVIALEEPEKEKKEVTTKNEERTL